MQNSIIIVLLFAMTALTQAALTTYTPAFLAIANDFQVNAAAIEMTLSLYLFGFGLSQLVYGPLSDRYGRKKLLIISMILFSMGCALSIISNNYWDFTFSRFIQGLGAGSCMALSRALTRDCFKGADYVKAASYLSSGFAVGLACSQLVGSFLCEFFSWRSGFVFLFIWGVTLLLSFYFLLPETNKHLQNDIPLKKFTLRLINNCNEIIKDKNFILFLLTGVLSYSIIIIYTTMTPFLFQETLQVTTMTYAWITFFIGITYYLGTALNRYLLCSFEVRTIMMCGIWLIILSGFLILFGYAVFPAANMYIIAIPLLLAIIGQALVWSNCIAGALQNLSLTVGTASAFFSFLQMILITMISGAISTIEQHDQVPFALLILFCGISSLAIMLLLMPKASEVYQEST